MSLKLENIIVFTIYSLLKGAAHRRRRAVKQTPNYNTLAAPTSLSQPPQPRATADLIPWRWMVALAAMDGGAFVVSIGGKRW